MSTISASTTSTTAYSVTGDTTGTLVFKTGATPTTAVTIDASQNVTFAKGITVGATAAPAFSAYANANTSLSSGVWTKIAFQAEEFDTNNNFDSTTNYRFTPTVAGYYQINACVQINGGTVVTQFGTAIYKNGSEYKRNIKGDTNGLYALPVTSLVYFNGSTDYVEIYSQCTYSVGTVNANASASVTYFNGSMTRSA
jgi:hypothetical protein